MISNLINIFLNNFNYLNSKGQRAGLIFFSNDKLTGDLEMEAKRTRELIDGIAKNHGIDDETSLQQFIDALRQSIEKVRKLREAHSPIETALSSVPSSDDPYTICYTLNKIQRPYAPSKFEREIIKGLKAALAEAEEERLKFDNSKEILGRFIEQCTLLKADIRAFSPNTIIVEKGTTVVQADPFPYYGQMI